MSFKKILKSNKIALGAGALCAFAFAPFNLFIAAIISLLLFYFELEKAQTRKEIFWCGFFYGFGYFITGIYWITISLLVDAAQFAWLIPFALTVIPSVLALYFVGMALAYKFFSKKFLLTEKYRKIILFALCWLFFEVLRSNLFSGFPWNLLGYSWMFSLKIAHMAAVFGIYGLSFFAVLTCLSPLLIFREDVSRKTFFKKSSIKRFSEINLGDKFLCGFVIKLVIVGLIFGAFHMDETKLVYDDKTKIRMVQANVKQEMKWQEEEKYKNFLKHIDLTNSKSLDGVKAVVWSETSVPYVMDSDPALISEISRAVPSQGILITGALRIEYGELRQIKNVWNSMFVLNKEGVMQYYDKHHLVPFGEYVPLQKFFPFIDKITGGGIGFSEGKGAQTLQTENFSFSPLICYEVIFSQEVMEKNKRPDLFINLTNDAWFGISTGPYQHFNMARMRAIEYGVSLLRVAGSGISAFIDPFGRVVKKLDLNDEGIIDVELVRSIVPTIYSIYGYMPLGILLLLFVLLVLFPRINEKKS